MICLVAGTAGGIGTTTVAALLFGQLQLDGSGAPLLIDHTGGNLAPRVPGGDDVERLDDQQRLYDLGCNVTTELIGAQDPQLTRFLVTAATPVGRDLAEEQIQALAERRGSGAIARTVVVLSEVFGRHRRLDQYRFGHEVGANLHGVVRLPADDALAAGGRIPLQRLSRPTRRAMRQLAELAAAVDSAP